MSATAQRSSTEVVLQEDVVTSPLARKVLAVARYIIGFYFLWAFLDKTFGLGFSTASDRAWIRGGAPAQGYLGNLNMTTNEAGERVPLESGDVGYQPIANLFKSLFTNGFGDFFFMLGLLGIGVAVIAGAGLRIAAVSGTLLMLFMYVVALPFLAASASNPILDSHWMEALLLIIAAVTLSGDTWGVGKWWANQDVVKKYSWLR